MSQYSGPYTAQDRGVAAEPSTTDVARNEAAGVGQSARDAGSQVAQTAADQARQVVAETGRQARDLLGEAQGQARDQASVQQHRAAEQLRTFADELHDMAAKSGQSGLATEVTRQAADRIEGAASWLEQREPGDLLDGVRDFARRRPGAFLIGAAVAGLAAGRLTRGLTSGGGQPEPRQSTVSGAPQASTLGGPTAGTFGGGPTAGTARPGEPVYPGASQDAAYPAEPAYPADTAAYPAEPAYPADVTGPAEPGYPADTAAYSGEPTYPEDAPAYPAEPGTAPGAGPGTGGGVSGQPENYYPDGGRESYGPGQP